MNRWKGIGGHEWACATRANDGAAALDRRRIVVIRRHACRRRMMFARVDGVTAERSGERTVVLDANGRVLSTLSPVGTIVWEALPGDRSDLLEHLQEFFPEIDEDVLHRDLELFIDELVSVELITPVDAAS